MATPRATTLTFRFTATLVTALALLLAVAAWLQIALQQRYAQQVAVLNGLVLSESLYGALHSSMLANDRDSLRAAARTIAERTPNVRIRIFNKEGLINFSSLESELGTKLDPRSEACYKCHASDRPIDKLPPGDRTRSFELAEVPAIGVIKPIENEPACSGGACHAHAPEKRLLGVLDVTITLPRVQLLQRQTTALMVVTTALAMLLVVGMALSVVRRSVDRPIRRLTRTLDALAGGDHTARFEGGGSAEFEHLGDALNRTATQLERANAELVEWAQMLERRVEEKTAEVRRAQDQMVRIERMASLGKLAAVVAHEINNPLASVVTYARLLLRRCNEKEPMTDECRANYQYLDAIASESARCGEIVSNLLLFARKTGSRFEPSDANELARKALFLIKHKADLAQVELVEELAPDLPRVLCDPGQIQQALLALCINGVEAMNEGGRLTVRSWATAGGGVRLEVADAGVGMSEEVRAHIFEPFFTTKDEGEGKGLGLGLAVVYGIVQRHGGTINVESAPGQGTTFTLELATQPPRSGEESA